MLIHSVVHKSTTFETLLVKAQQAMETGSPRRRRFEAVLDPAQSGETLFGLGMALWWLAETEPSLRHLERAYAVFRGCEGCAA